MRQRLGGRAEYADRVRLGSIILIVRDIDETDHISSVGMSLEAVEPAMNLPIFLNFHEIAARIRSALTRRREASASPVSQTLDGGEKED
jgi:cell volume regulation protein A